MILVPQYHQRIAMERDLAEPGAGGKYLDRIVVDDAIPYAALFTKKPEMVIRFIKNCEYPKALIETTVQILVRRNCIPPMEETQELKNAAMDMFASNANWALCAVYFISETIPMLPDEYKS